MSLPWLCFFFFKQKTAYEMRISDWSSDVCSSDLVQDPGYRAPVAGTLDLGEAAVTPVSNVIPWPATLPEQVGAVQSILAAAPAPLGAGDIARNFKGKRAATVRPVLDALAGLGMARRLNA